LTLMSAPGQRASIVGNVIVRDSADGVTLRSLNVSGGSGFSVMYVYGDQLTLSDIDLSAGGVRNCVLAGAGAESSPGNRADDLVIVRSRIHHCGNDNHEHAIYAEFTRRLVVRDSYLYTSGGYGLHFYPDADDSLVEYTVVDSNGGGSGYAGNVTFSGESAGGEYEQSYRSDRNVIRYSLVTFPADGQNIDSYWPSGAGSGNEVAFSCVYAPGKSNFAGGGYSQHDNRNSDPQYSNRTTGNYTLATTSPCTGWGPR
jgi:hypothetical protein